jgi:fatty acid desaturase
MIEDFHQSSKLPKDKLITLMQRNDHPALIRFIIMYSLFLVISAWVVISWNGALWNMILSQIAFGIMCCSIFACLHETAHNTAFKSKFLNQLTAVLTGLAHLYPAALFRELHFAHHRHTHVPGLDPEISIGNKPAPSVIGALPTYFGWLSGIPLLLFKIGMLIMGAFGMPEPARKMLYPFVRTKMRISIALESAFVLLVYTGIGILAYTVHSGFWGLFTGQIVGHCFLAGYLVPEHNGLPHEGNIMNRTRSMNTSKLLKLLMWNMPYHAEHHAYPSIPFHALPQLHEELKEELLHKDEGHPEFHLKTLGRMIVRKQ